MENVERSVGRILRVDSDRVNDPEFKANFEEGD